MWEKGEGHRYEALVQHWIFVFCLRVGGWGGMCGVSDSYPTPCQDLGEGESGNMRLEENSDPLQETFGPGLMEGVRIVLTPHFGGRRWSCRTKPDFRCSRDLRALLYLLQDRAAESAAPSLPLPARIFGVT